MKINLLMKIAWKAYLQYSLKHITGTSAEGQYNGGTFKYVGVLKVLFSAIWNCMK